MQRVCRDCGIPKDESEFYPGKPNCKVCYRAATNARNAIKRADEDAARGKYGVPVAFISFTRMPLR